MQITMGSSNDIGLAEISALLAALGILIYILGMIALCWPVYQKITHDATTALYAVSLMPKTVVAGQGVRMLFGLPFVLTIVLVPLLLVMGIILNLLGQAIDSFWVFVAVDVLITGIFIGIFLYFISRIRNVLQAFALSGSGLWAQWIARGTSIVVGPLSALVVVRTFFEPEAILPSVPSWVSALKALMLILLLYSCTAFVRAFTSEPPLPEIALNGSTTAEGKLVAHADGIWYVLDDNGKLIGIPDDKAGRVLVFPN